MSTRARRSRAGDRTPGDAGAQVASGAGRRGDVELPTPEPGSMGARPRPRHLRSLQRSVGNRSTVRILRQQPIAQRTPGDGDGRAGFRSAAFREDARLRAARVNSPPVKMGERGPAVVLIQGALIDAGHELPNSMRDRAPDGIFGPETYRAVRSFQRDRGLTVDGQVGRNTVRQLDLLTSETPGTVQIGTPSWVEPDGAGGEAETTGTPPAPTGGPTSVPGATGHGHDPMTGAEPATPQLGQPAPVDVPDDLQVFQVVHQPSYIGFSSPVTRRQAVAYLWGGRFHPDRKFFLAVPTSAQGHAGEELRAGGSTSQAGAEPGYTQFYIDRTIPSLFETMREEVAEWLGPVSPHRPGIFSLLFPSWVPPEFRDIANRVPRPGEPAVIRPKYDGPEPFGEILAWVRRRRSPRKIRVSCWLAWPERRSFYEDIADGDEAVAEYLHGVCTRVNRDMRHSFDRNRDISPGIALTRILMPAEPELRKLYGLRAVGISHRGGPDVSEIVAGLRKRAEYLRKTGNFPERPEPDVTVEGDRTLRDHIRDQTIHEGDLILRTKMSVRHLQDVYPEDLGASSEDDEVTLAMLLRDLAGDYEHGYRVERIEPVGPETGTGLVHVQPVVRLSDTETMDVGRAKRWGFRELNHQFHVHSISEAIDLGLKIAAEMIKIAFPAARGGLTLGAAGRYLGKKVFLAGAKRASRRVVRRFLAWMIKRTQRKLAREALPTAAEVLKATATEATKEVAKQCATSELAGGQMDCSSVAEGDLDHVKWERVVAKGTGAGLGTLASELLSLNESDEYMHLQGQDPVLAHAVKDRLKQLIKIELPRAFGRNFADNVWKMVGTMVADLATIEEEEFEKRLKKKLVDDLKTSAANLLKGTLKKGLEDMKTVYTKPSGKW